MVEVVAADTSTQLVVPARQVEVADVAAPPDAAWACEWEFGSFPADVAVARVEVAPPEEVVDLRLIVRQIYSAC